MSFFERKERVPVTEELCRLAEAYVRETVQKYRSACRLERTNAAVRLLLGLSDVRIETRPDGEHSHAAMLEGFYRCYRAAGEAIVPTMLSEGLNACADDVLWYIGVAHVLDYLDLILEAEARGTAPFRTDCAQVMATLKAAVARKLPLLRGSLPWFDDWFDDELLRLWQKHGFES